MDDIFGDLIYLLILGASVVGGIYRNYAKKKQEERKRQQMSEISEAVDTQSYEAEVNSPPSMPRNIEDFLREQFEFEMEPENGPEEIVTQPEPTVKSEASKKEGVAAFENTNEALLSDNLNDKDFSISNEIRKHEKMSDMHFEEIDDSNSAIFSEDEKFDIRKAIIYSEIVKRPYQ